MSARLLPTASGIERALACRASAVLPRAPDESSEDAQRGTALHAYVEAVASGEAPESALARVPAEWRPAAASLDVHAILEAIGWDPFGDQTLTVEEAFAWHPVDDRARSLGCGLERDYSGADPLEFVGTADVLLVDRDRRRVVVLDYKFGHGHVTRAAVNPQLRSLALFAARTHGMDVAQVVIVRAREDGSAWLDRAPIDRHELDEVALELHALTRRIARDREGDQAVATGGEHCRYCRSARACPLGPMALAVASGTGLEPMRATPAGRARLLALRSLAQRLPDLIDDELRAAIEDGDASLPDGQELFLETTEKRKVDDAEAVYAFVAAARGVEAAEAAAPMERSATMTSIKAAAKRWAAKGKATAEGDALVASLLEAGAVKVSSSGKVSVRRAS